MGNKINLKEERTANLYHWPRNILKNCSIEVVDNNKLRWLSKLKESKEARSCSKII